MFPPQILVVFHPKSESSRKLGDAINQALNCDPVIPGLRVPTYFLPEDATTLPPVDFDITTQGSCFVVGLADDQLKVGCTGKIPDNRLNWDEWFANLYDTCHHEERLRCIPFQLTEHAWPPHDRLNGVNLPRAFAVVASKREKWIINRIVLELIRFLNGDLQADNDDPSVPLTVFISHTKLDIDKDPKPVHKILDYLGPDQPIKAWVDSGDIEGGSKFQEAIQKGVKNSALLCILTDSYSSREWCREEICLAKEYQRPVVIVDALQSIEMRSFPYCGNVPVIRWNDEPEDALFLLLKEALRQMHVQQVLHPQMAPSETLLLSPPELFTLVGNEKKEYVYPDPPLSEGELKRLVKSGATVKTPLQRFAQDQPFKGQRILLSLSESTDIDQFGMGLAHLKQAMVELSRYLLFAGATLCYGGHLAKGGYTQALFELVKSHPLPNIPAPDRIQCYIGWPVPLTLQQRAEFKACGDFVQTNRPAELSERDDPAFTEKIETGDAYFPPDSGIKRYAWARGMSIMRQEQCKDPRNTARIILGGKIGPTPTVQADGIRQDKWYNSRIPGVLEEVLCSIENKQPVFLIGGFGGCARMVADIIEGKSRQEMSWDYHRKAPCAEEMKQEYLNRGGDWWDYPEMTEYIKQKGFKGLNNHLSETENATLFHTKNVDEIVRLLLKGLNH